MPHMVPASRTFNLSGTCGKVQKASFGHLASLRAGLAPVDGNQKSALHQLLAIWAMKKGPGVFWGMKYRSYVGIIISHCKDP